MSEFFWSTYIVLWLLVAILIIMLVLLYRQFGLMWMRSSRRIGLAGLDIGATAPDVGLEDASGDEFTLAWRRDDSVVSAWMLLFALPSCPICKSLLETVGRLPDAWPNVEFVWIDASVPHVSSNGKSKAIPRGWRIGVSASELAHQTMEVPAVPYGYVVRPGGIVASKGLVNSVDDIVSLLSTAPAETPAALAEFSSQS